MKEFDQYQTEAKRTCSEEFDLRDRLLIGALNMGSEAGEAIGLIKKAIYHGHELDSKKLALELSDVLWALAITADAIGYSLSEVAQLNVDKLRARYPNGFSHEASRNRKEEGK